MMQRQESIMKFSEKISVIIPVYKVETYLRQCLDSVIGQTYQNLEIILIDDGSPDHCGAICDEYAAKDSRITVVHKENGGLSSARNDGIKRTTGDWIAFVDSDDWCETDYYEQLLAAAQGRTPDIISAGGYYKNYPGKQKVFHTFDKPYYYHNRESIMGLQANVTKTGLPWDKLYKADFIKNHGFVFDSSIKAFEDFLFNFQVYEKVESIVVCQTIGYHYRQAQGSIATGFNPAKPQINYQYLTKLHEYAVQYGMGEKRQEGVNACTIVAIAVAMNCYFFHPANTKKHSEVNKELMQMVSLPYCQEAINSKSNRYLSHKQAVLKYALRTRQEWLLRMLYTGKQKLTT